NAAEVTQPVGRGAALNGSESVKTEAQLLQQAQAGLADDPALALAQATEHARRFPGGALSQEREVIAILALQKLGRLDEARARAERFLARYPASAHRRRMEALVGGGSAKDSPVDAGAPPAAL